jgi:carboxylesterase
MTPPVIPGAEAWSHTAGSARGALVLHGFTGNPSSVRNVAEGFAAAGFDVELPRLPGHGTNIEEMLTTSWSDWSGAAQAAYQSLRSRCGAVVVAGLSMGGTLALWLAARHPEIAALICINPAAQPQSDEVVEMVAGMIAAGETVLPGLGGDIAKPGVVETSYPGTPLPCLHSMLTEGIATVAPSYPTLRMPMLLCSSLVDHVVDPAQGDYLAEHYGGPLRRLRLEHSFHVATLDHDADLVVTAAVAFGSEPTAEAAA